MALCVYHKPDDLYQLMNISYKYNPDYRYALRQCTDGHGEQVLYVV